MDRMTVELIPAVYARATARRGGEPEPLKVLVEGSNWRRTGGRQ
jgi:hypothetical protein